MGGFDLKDVSQTRLAQDSACYPKKFISGAPLLKIELKTELVSAMSRLQFW